jgi:uncharacterized protein YecE (DUF72 family)
VALAWAENPKLPLTLEATADFVCVHLEGDRKAVQGLLGKVEVDKTAATAEWANRLKSYVTAGKTVFAYFGKFYSGFPPSDVQQLVTQLNA